MNCMKMTFGSELELADVDTRLTLPAGNKWDYKDYSIMNSSGIGNDPLKELVSFGGEINVRPTDSIDGQLNEILNIYNKLGERKSINHTTNFHIHVRVPGLSGNLKLLKQVATFIFKNQCEIFNITEELIIPNKCDYNSIEAYKGAIKRYKRRKISHQNKLSLNIYNKMMNSDTIIEFYNSHFPVSKTGQILYHLATRCGINLMQLFNETDTIEYRHFSMSFDEFEIYSCLRWVEDVTKLMFTDGVIMDIVENMPGAIFPKFVKYDHEKQKIFDLTHFGKLNRNEIKANLDMLVKNGVITKKDLH